MYCEGAEDPGVSSFCAARCVARMHGMKLQFSLATLLVCVSVMAVVSQHEVEHGGECR